MTETGLVQLKAEDYESAFTEVSFLLDIFSGSAHELMGGAGASIGRLAGRHAARKFPLHIPDADLERVLAALQNYLADGFGFQSRVHDGGAEIEYGYCVVRDVCRRRGLEAGGTLCRLVHHYLDGVVNELLGRRAKSTIESAGATCRTNLEVR